MNDGKTKKAQKHKNTTAFKIIFDTQALQKQKKVSLANLCARCTQVMQWKLQYNKYKKMGQAARCNICMDKNVFRTYMKACQNCVMTKNICAKCLTADYEPPTQVKTTQKDQKQQQRKQHSSQIQFMKTLQQRSRRTVRRGLQKGKISWDQGDGYFLDQEGNKINLHFRKGFTVVDDENQDEDNSDGDDLGDDDQDVSGGQQQDGQELIQKQGITGRNKSQNKQQKQTQTKQQSNNKYNKPNKDTEKINHNSDVEGDEVDCSNDIDLDDEDFEDQDQQEEEVKQVTSKKVDKKEQKKNQ